MDANLQRYLDSRDGLLVVLKRAKQENGPTDDEKRGPNIPNLTVTLGGLILNRRKVKKNGGFSLLTIPLYWQQLDRTV